MFLALTALLAITLARAAAQQPRITAADAQFDQASVDRGQQLFVNQ